MQRQTKAKFDSRRCAWMDGPLSLMNDHFDLSLHLTPSRGISETSGSVISGQKIQSYFFGFDDVIPDGNFFVSR